MAKVDHNKIVDDILSNIEYLENMGLGADNIYATEQDKVKAFEKAGYEVSL